MRIRFSWAFAALTLTGCALSEPGPLDSVINSSATGPEVLEEGPSKIFGRGEFVFGSATPAPQSRPNSPWQWIFIASNHSLAFCNAGGTLGYFLGRDPIPATARTAAIFGKFTRGNNRITYESQYSSEINYPDDSMNRSMLSSQSRDSKNLSIYSVTVQTDKDERENGVITAMLNGNKNADKQMQTSFISTGHGLVRQCRDATSIANDHNMKAGDKLKIGKTLYEAADVISPLGVMERFAKGWAGGLDAH